MKSIPLKLLPCPSRSVFAFCQPQLSNRSATTFYSVLRAGNNFPIVTSPDKAWKSLEKLSKISFRLEDQKILKTATRYQGRHAPKVSGNKRQAIVLQRYGEGLKALDMSLERCRYTGWNYWGVKYLEMSSFREEGESVSTSRRKSMEPHH